MVLIFFVLIRKASAGFLTSHLASDLIVYAFWFTMVPRRPWCLHISLSFCKSKECINGDEYTEVKLNGTCDCTVWKKKRAPGPSISAWGGLTGWWWARSSGFAYGTACVTPACLAPSQPKAEGWAGLSLWPTGSRSLGGLKSACHSEPNTDIFLIIIWGRERVGIVVCL